MISDTYRSAGSGVIRYYLWEPRGTMVGAIQLVHGIAERGSRYGEFAEFLASNGYLVGIQDHMGHGESICLDCPRGGIRGGWDAMVKDVNALTEILRSRCPDLPRFLLGHSMGSFLARTCLYTYPEACWHGAILSGTAWQPGPVLAAGRLMAKLEIRRQGADAPSPRLQKLMFGAYGKQFPGETSPDAWICSDPAVVARYGEDPLCGFAPSGSLIHAMLEGIGRNQKPENLAKMPPSLPVYFIAGDRDPVGSSGKGVLKSCEEFRKAGLRQTEVRLWPGDRHEVLNEVNKAEVWADVLDWLRTHAD